MEIRLKHLLLGVAFALGMGNINFAAADAEPTVVQVIEPDIERRKIKTAKIDKENFEVGGFFGLMSIQDFDSSSIYGARAAYHMTEDFFVEASYGQATGSTTSAEDILGGSPFFSESDRELTYYDVSLGWNILPGEIFIGNRWAFNSSLYLIAGVGNTDFLGDSWFTVNVGAGFRLLFTDAIAWHIDVRDHIFDRDAFGQSEQTHNFQFNSGFTFFF